MLNKQVASLLGLAMRARKLATGESALKAVQSQQAHFVFIASDASDNTKKKYIDKCTYYHVDYYVAGTSEELSLILLVKSIEWQLRYLMLVLRKV